MKLISDKILAKVPIKDNGEKLVSLKKVCPKIEIKLDSISNKYQKLPPNTCFVREGVAKKLKKIINLLPKDYSLLVYDAHRPIKLQEIMYNKKYFKMKRINPSWSEKRVREETSKFVSPPDIVPPHCTGGTVDLTIIDKNKKPLNMGTRVNVNNKKSSTESKNISKEAIKNRNLLIKVMEEADFVNYPTEWWHWSYGDRYWAVVNNKKYSIYKEI